MTFLALYHHLWYRTESTTALYLRFRKKARMTTPPPKANLGHSSQANSGGGMFVPTAGRKSIFWHYVSRMGGMRPSPQSRARL